MGTNALGGRNTLVRPPPFYYAAVLLYGPSSYDLWAYVFPRTRRKLMYWRFQQGSRRKKDDNIKRPASFSDAQALTGVRFPPDRDATYDTPPKNRRGWLSQQSLAHLFQRPWEGE